MPLHYIHYLLFIPHYHLCYPSILYTVLSLIPYTAVAPSVYNVPTPSTLSAPFYEVDIKLNFQKSDIDLTRNYPFLSLIQWVGR